MLANGRPDPEAAALHGQLRACQADLRAAQQELELLCHAVSHDVRAPLRAVDGFARMLRDRCAPQFTEEDLRLLDVVFTNTAKMNRLIDDLVLYARLLQHPLRPQQVDMNALAQEVWNDVPHADAVQLKLHNLPPAWGDRGLLKEAWGHLLANAVKFSALKDEPMIEVSGESKDAETVYDVRDNGAGFDMAYADKLFAVFQRLHAAKEFAGNGIGLAMTARVVKRHGGRIGAEGRVGQGARFWFALPVATAAQQTATVPIQMAAALMQQKTGAP